LLVALSEAQRLEGEVGQREWTSVDVSEEDERWLSDVADRMKVLSEAIAALSVEDGAVA
jgi:hypothetical protein